MPLIPTYRRYKNPAAAPCLPRALQQPASLAHCQEFYRRIGCVLYISFNLLAANQAACADKHDAG